MTIETCTRELTLIGSKEIRVGSRGVQPSTRWLARTLAKLLGSKRTKTIRRPNLSESLQRTHQLDLTR
ncbi:hypothetical protein [Micromonospora haikouensis]|uniref:hypothetical protein n=1 Tax=Micromonospora haikouensis TaxID=686309 RepID=UPI000A8F8210|nr:hypothetical protein [Micromonospora haikouensis]